MAGINKAVLKKSISESKTSIDSTDPCVFLSHISIDKAIAIKIGDYLTQNGDIDIYLDIYDDELQIAASQGDARAITQFIDQGLDGSSHIMCLVSEKTIGSWWVPYEIGFGKKGNKEISTLLLKYTTSLPEYLKVGEILKGTKSLNAYLKKLKSSMRKSYISEALDALSDGNLISHSTLKHPLDGILNWKL